MSTQLEVAFEVLAETEREIKQTDLLTRVSRRHGSSRESVRGSIIGDAPSKLMGKAKFKENWVYCRKPTRFVRREFATESEKYKTSYDTKEKKLARLRGFAEFFRMNLSHPKVLTLASDNGYCVKQILELFPDAEITNVEVSYEILKEYEKLDLETINILGDLRSFVFGDKMDFDFLNLDLMGYMCDSNYHMFEEINRKTTAGAITVNLQYGKRLRNRGSWVEAMRSELADDDDQIKTLMERAFDKFKLVDCFMYTRDSSENCRPMRMFVFRRKWRR